MAPREPKRRRIAYGLTNDQDLIPVLVEIERQSFTGYYAPHRFDDDDFAYYLSISKTINVVAFCKGKSVGYVLGVVKQRSHRHLARIYSLAVVRQYRRQGIGLRLMRKFVAEARGRGCRVVYAEAAVRNRGALELFKRCGFRRVRLLRDHYGGGVDGIRLRLAITR